MTTKIGFIGLSVIGLRVARPLREAQADSVLFGDATATGRAAAQVLGVTQNFPGVTLPGGASGV